MAEAEVAQRKSFWSYQKELESAEKAVVAKSNAVINKASTVSPDISKSFLNESGKLVSFKHYAMVHFMYN